MKYEFDFVRRDMHTVAMVNERLYYFEKIPEGYILRIYDFATGKYDSTGFEEISAYRITDISCGAKACTALAELGGEAYLISIDCTEGRYRIVKPDKALSEHLKDNTLLCSDGINIYFQYTDKDNTVQTVFCGSDGVFENICSERCEIYPLKNKAYFHVGNISSINERLFSYANSEKSDEITERLLLVTAGDYRNARVVAECNMAYGFEVCGECDDCFYYVKADVGKTAEHMGMCGYTGIMYKYDTASGNTVPAGYDANNSYLLGDAIYSVCCGDTYEIYRNNDFLLKCDNVMSADGGFILLDERKAYDLKNKCVVEYDFLNDILIDGNILTPKKH